MNKKEAGVGPIKNHNSIQSYVFLLRVSFQFFSLECFTGDKNIFLIDKTHRVRSGKDGVVKVQDDPWDVSDQEEGHDPYDGPGLALLLGPVLVRSGHWSIDVS